MSDRRPAQPIRLFYAYVHQDEDLRETLEAHLNSPHDEGSFLHLHECGIDPGEDVEMTLDQYLETASLILLLVSIDFLNSTYYRRKMPRIMERYNAGKVSVIPILLRPCNWQETLFGDLLALPRNGEPITLWKDRDEAFLEVEQNLRTLLGQESRTHPSSRRDTIDWDRENMLVRLQSMYELLLNDALHQVAWIDPGLSTQPGAVENAANLLLRRSTQTAHEIQPGSSISQIYRQANQELLLLGAPGAGKSTLLYQLARDLLRKASIQPNQPLPILFPLSSWAEKRLPLATWMAEQLTSPIYEMPRKLSQRWVQDQLILPLLDGLDEMKEEARPACIAAINAYRREHPLCPLVVCSRSTEYSAASTHEHLRLQSAVGVQPLTQAQVDGTLIQAGEPFAALRSELSTNPDLQKLALTPLWLTVLLLTCKDIAVETLPQQRPELQEHLFQLYVERMVGQKGDDKRYPLADTNAWLSWLAKQMQERSLGVFAVELLQPDWLGKKLYNLYQCTLVISIGLILYLTPGLNFAPLNRLTAGLIISLCIGIIKRLNKGRIKLAEKVIWSWKKTLRWGFITWLLALLISWPLSWLLPKSYYWPFTMLIAGLMYALLIGLISGLSVEQHIERKALSPGAGLIHSLENGVSIGLISGLSIGSLAGLGVGLIFWQQGPITGLLAGLYAGLLFGLSFGLVFLLFFGLYPIAEHFLLRFWFWRIGVLPLRIGTFLEDARARHLIQCVGGGYRFVHPLLQDYFVNLDPTAPPTQTPEKEPL